MPGKHDYKTVTGRLESCAGAVVRTLNNVVSQVVSAHRSALGRWSATFQCYIRTTAVMFWKVEEDVLEYVLLGGWPGAAAHGVSGDPVTINVGMSRQCHSWYVEAVPQLVCRGSASVGMSRQCLSWYVEATPFKVLSMILF